MNEQSEFSKVERAKRVFWEN